MARFTNHTMTDYSPYQIGLNNATANISHLHSNYMMLNSSSLILSCLVKNQTWSILADLWIIISVYMKRFALCNKTFSNPKHLHGRLLSLVQRLNSKCFKENGT